jgi:dehydratase
VFPEQVAAGSTFQLKLTADPIVVPTEGGGYPISYLRNVRVRFAVPAGTSYVGATLEGGSNLGSGTPTVTQSGGIVTLTVPGNLAPGTTAVLPTVIATFQATGATGTTILSRLHGNSYDNFSIAFIARITNVPLFGSLDATTQCYSPANPLLATIVIG